MAGQGKPKWWRRFWIEAAIVLVTFSALDVALCLFNVIDLNGLAQGILWMFSAIFVTYAIRHIMLDVLSDKTVLRIMKIAFPMLGACFGVILGLILASPRLIDINQPWVNFSLFWVGPTVGALIGYRVGKRRGFRPLFRRYIDDV